MMQSDRANGAALLATAVVVLAIVAGIATLGAPSAARQRRLDARRSRDLIMIRGSLDDYWNRRKFLPLSLDTLVSDHDLASVPHDPETGAPYPYSVTTPSTFRLCATFQRSSDDDADDRRFAIADRHWQHAVGLTCFDLAPHTTTH
jgi:type II secretory pathway pseudopilin PulG